MAPFIRFPVQLMSNNQHYDAISIFRPTFQLLVSPVITRSPRVVNTRRAPVCRAIGIYARHSPMPIHNPHSLCKLRAVVM